jgi:hypothetical protein
MALLLTIVQYYDIDGAILTAVNIIELPLFPPSAGKTNVC